MDADRSPDHDRLVNRMRGLVEAVALTAVQGPALIKATQALTRIEDDLRASSFSSVPRTPPPQVVGAERYVWQWANPGLPEISMSFERATVTAIMPNGLGPVHAGPPGVVHGGVAAMLLDAVMSSLLQSQGISAVTATLTTEFCAPTPTDSTFVIRASMEQVTERRAEVSGSICVGDLETVRAAGAFARLAALEDFDRIPVDTKQQPA